MVRVKRPTRSMASERVSKDNDPNISLTAVDSEVEQHGKEKAHASSPGINHDLDERCSEHCLTTSNGCSAMELDNNKSIPTDQLSKQCDEETHMITSNPDSTTTFNNVATDVKLKSYARSEYRRNGSLFAVEPLKTYYRRRKGFIRPVKLCKTYPKRRSAYEPFGMSPLLVQNSTEIKVDDIDLGYPMIKPMHCVVNNTCQKEMSARDGEFTNISVDMVVEKDMELDSSQKSDIIVDKTCDVLSGENNLRKSTNYIKNDVHSGITSDTELVERKQKDVEEASLVPTETMQQQIISQPGRADGKLLSEDAPSGSIKRKLLVLDINGLLADIVPAARVSPESKLHPDTIVAGKAVFKRPFCDEFLEFCFERFSVGVWSSRTKKNVDTVLNFLMGEKRQNLLFCWDQSHCTCTSYYTPDNINKPLVFKKLNKLWENSETNLPWKRGDYDESCTLLLDDSPYKALLNPPNTAIFPQTYLYSNEKDSSLGPDGDLRIYLEGLSMAPNVQEYVKHNPYGQDPITEDHASWSFYHEVIESTVVGSLRKPYQSSVSSVKLQKGVFQVNNTTVVAEISKGLLGCNGTFQQHEKSISNGSPSSTARGCKRARSQSPTHDVSKRQSRSLSPKICRRSKSPAPSHGSDFGGDKAANYQTLRPECRNFPQGRCLRGTTCRFEHHQSLHQSYTDRGVHEHEGQIFKPQFAPRECYAFSQGKCNWGASCRFSHSVPDKTDLGTEANETLGKQCDDIRRGKALTRECRDFVQGKCSWGASCRFLHTVPDKTDLGTEAKETHVKQCDDIRRGQAVPRECRDFIQGKCNWGASCRFSHSLPDKTDLGAEANETHGEQRDDIKRDKAVPRECRDFVQGKCSWGASCRFSHSVADKTGLGMEANETQGEQCDDIKRDKAVPRECRDFIQGKCIWGASCRFLHTVPDKTDLGLEANETHGKQRDDIKRDRAVSRECRDFIQGKCSWGASCRFSHSLPDKTDLGAEANETHGEQCDDIKRDKAVPRECRDFIQGKCSWGASCRFSHSVADKTGLGTEANETQGEQCDDIKRDKAVPRECRDFIQGKCSWGASCRFLHTVPDKTDLGTEAKETHVKQCDDIRRGQAVPRECRDFIQGKCCWGASCRFSHSLPDKTDLGAEANETHGEQCDDIKRDKAVPRECRDFVQGKCSWGASCRFSHSVADKTGLGMEANETQGEQCDDIKRDKAVPQECRDSIQGECSWGATCLFLKSVPRKNDLGREGTEAHDKQCDDIRRDKAVPRGCYDFMQGKCNRGASCRFQHSLPKKTDLGTEGCDNIRSDKAVPRECRHFLQGKCNSGESCQFLHSVPDKNDIGIEAHETHHKQCYNISRENAVQRECNDFIRGKCNLGSSCRYLHSVCEKTDSSFHNRYYQDVTSSSKISDDCGKDQSSSFNEHYRYKAVAEVCRNYTQGRCYRGSRCQHLHQELGSPVGLRSTTSQPGDTSRFKAVREVCRNYTWGRCHYGLNCRHLHQEQNLTGSEFTTQVVDMSRYKSMPEACRNYSQGRCHKGSDCRFWHPEPFMSVGSGSTSQLGETSRFNTVAEVCRNYTQGRCHKGSDCRYLHQELGPTFGLGSTSQFGETSRYQAPREVCRNYIQGRCHKGSDCWYQHRESILGSGPTGGDTSRYQAPPEVCRNYIQGRCHKGSDCRYKHREAGLTLGSGSTGQFGETSRFIAMPEVCRNYTHGRCHKGSDCLYRHQEPGASTSPWQTKYFPHQITSSSLLWNTKTVPQGKCFRGDGDLALKSENFGSFSDTGSIRHETSVHEHAESRTQELIPGFSVVDGKRGTVEVLPNQHIDSGTFQEAYIVRDDDAEDIKHLESHVHVSKDNLGDSDRMIVDADDSCHETSIHEDTESGTKESIPNFPNFPVTEEKRGTMEALHNHPIHSNSYQKASVVSDDNTKNEKVLENVVCDSSMDNLGDSDRIIQEADNQPAQMSDL